MPIIDQQDGIQKLNPAPTGAGGLLLQQDLLELASRVSTSYRSTSAPTVNNDSVDTAALGKTFFITSRWVKISSGTEEEFVCVKDTPGAAKWMSTTAGTGGGGGGSDPLKADKVVGGSTGHLTSLTADGNITDSGYAISGISLVGHVHDDRYFTESEVTTLLLGKVDTTRTINTTAPLTGGGALSSNLTLAISPASGSAAGSMSIAHFALLQNATSSNTASQLVLRSATGAFSAGAATTTSLTTGPIVATSITDNISTQKVEVIRNSSTATIFGPAKRLNFIEGTGIQLSVSQSANQVDVFIGSFDVNHIETIIASTLGISLISGITGTVSKTVTLKGILSGTTSMLSVSDFGPGQAIRIDLIPQGIDVGIFDHGILSPSIGGLGINLIDQTADSGYVLKYEVPGVVSVGKISTFDIDGLDTLITDALLGNIRSDDGSIDVGTSEVTVGALSLEIVPESTVQKIRMYAETVLGGSFADLNLLSYYHTLDITLDGGAYSIDVLNNTTTQKVEVGWFGSTYGVRKKINFIPGSSISIDVADNATDDQVDVTINATGTAAGEANTITNIGTAGIGVFKQKVAADLQLKKINAAAGGRITVTDNTAENRIDLDVPDNTSNQKLRVSKAGTLIGTRKQINIIDGGNITTTVADDGVNDRVNITIAASGGATGEANVGVNVGAGGVGIYKQKTGVNLEFKNINVGSSKLSVTNDTANSEVDLDVVEANLTHNNIGGTLGLVKGGTGANLSASGGTGQYLKQVTVGGVVTVGTIAATDLPTGIDAIKIGGGAVSNAEFAFLDGVTSSIQTQLNARAALVHTHVSTDISDFTEASQDVLGAIFADSTTLDASYNDTLNTFSVDVKNNTAIQKVEVAKAGTLVGTRKRLNFIDGSGASLVIADNSGSDRVDITVNASGIGEINTASNVNAAGIGVYKQKTGVNFEFKGIDTNTAGISITDDVANNSIDIDLLPENIDINTIGAPFTTLGLGKGGTGSDLSGTGGPGFFLKQMDIGYPIMVGPMMPGDIPDNISCQDVRVGISDDMTHSGTEIGVRRRLNFISGGNLTIEVVDNETFNRIDVVLAGIGGGGGGANVLDDLVDVAITSVANNNVLQYNGTNWVNRTLATAGISAVGHTHTSSAITDATNAATANMIVKRDSLAGFQAGTIIAGNRTYNSSSTITEAGLNLTPTYAQGGTASSADILIQRTETSLGSGAHYFVFATVGGALKYSISNTGAILTVGTITAGSTIATNGALTTGTNTLTGALVINGAVTSARDILMQTAGVNRWILRADGTAEGGSNSGTNLGIIARKDDGTINMTALQLMRDTGRSVFNTADSSSSGTFVGCTKTHTYTQTSTAASIDLIINRIETGIGSGSHKFVDFQISGTSKFSVDNAGNVTSANRSVPKKYNALIGDGSTTVFTITQATHGCASDQSNSARINDATTGDQAVVPISYGSGGNVVITFSTAPATNAYRVVIVG
jgi:hypothetical protein